MSVTGIQNEINRIKQNIENVYSVYEALGADIPTEKTSDNLVPTAGTMKPVLYSPQTLTDVQKEQVRNNIGASKTTVLGDNPTGGVDNDTVDTWLNLGYGVAWISELNQVVNQPSQYGFIINYVHNLDVFQIFQDQMDGNTYLRCGDRHSSWFRDWNRIPTASGNDYIDVAGVRASEMITVGNDNEAMLIYTNGIGDRNSKLWIDAYGDAYFTEVYASQKKLATEEYVNIAVEQLSNENVALENKVDALPNNETLIANIADVVKTEVPLIKTAEQPTFVNSVDEMTDTSKVYVMPDGFLYAHLKNEGVSSYTFTADDFVADGLNTNGALLGTGTKNRIATKSKIDLSKGAVSIYCPTPYQYITYYYTDIADSSYIGKTTFKSGTIDNVMGDTVTSGTLSGAKYCRISLRDSRGTTADLSGRIDEFVANVIISQASDTPTETYAWQSTGLSYNQPTDYESRIVALENALGGIENGTY